MQKHKLIIDVFWLLRLSTCKLNREVEAANPAAVNLYRKAGFMEQTNPNKLSKNVFMVKEL